MANKFGIRSGKLDKKSQIKAGTPSPKTLSFSFRYIDPRNQKFDYSQKESGYFCKVIERLSGLSTYTFSEVMAERSPALKAHPIDWPDTSEPAGFSNLNEQLRESTPYQFSISRNEHGRVHGFFIDDVFYVVWLDPAHRLYP
ncbi:hypothetical protein KXR63_10855 [Stutzerimonas chloritidismutans]|uniref:hypothetical protein n=1 Tax=Stutzerimonas chloritidismutans TaxID=203192 RepID=UPI003F16DD93